MARGQGNPARDRVGSVAVRATRDADTLAQASQHMFPLGLGSGCTEGAGAPGTHGPLSNTSWAPMGQQMLGLPYLLARREP